MRKTFHERAFEEYLYWQKNDKKVLQKINSLLKSIERDGVMKGEGKPEKLRHRADAYSRRIDDGNRLVYAIEKDCLHVISCKGHYDD